MSQLDATAHETITSGAAVLGRRRAGLFGLAVVGFLGLVGTFTCSNTTIPAGQNGTTNGLCSYPRSCYLVSSSGPNAGGCDDCSSTSRCRLVFTPTNPADHQSLSGTWSSSSWTASPAEWPGVCGLYPAAAGQMALCGTPETVCVARGPACNGYCVHRATTDGDMDDLGNPAACMLGAPLAPQRRSGSGDGGTQTYCPLSDDVCCASPVGPDGGAVGDGGVTGDGGAAVDAAPADQASVG